jgi:hypothetical protein
VEVGEEVYDEDDVEEDDGGDDEVASSPLVHEVFVENHCQKLEGDGEGGEEDVSKDLLLHCVEEACGVVDGVEDGEVGDASYGEGDVGTIHGSS